MRAAVRVLAQAMVLGLVVGGLVVGALAVASQAGRVSQQGSNGQTSGPQTAFETSMDPTVTSSGETSVGSGHESTIPTLTEPPVTPAPGTPGHWVKTFDDDFTGSSLNTLHWVSNRSGNEGVDGGFNPSIEMAAFSSDNVTVSDGELKLTVQEKVSVVAGHSYPLTSGTVSTKGKFTFHDGEFVEARVIIPEGDGLWPSFWARTTDDGPPEIDGFEFFNTKKEQKPRANYQPPGRPQRGPIKYGLPSVDYTVGWHTYGWLLKDGVMTPYLDGVAYPSAAAKGVENRDYFLILSLSVYKGHHPVVAGDVAQMRVDWVRVWKPIG